MKHGATGYAKPSKRTGADALLITNFTNVTYLTGFTGDDSYLLRAAGRRDSS